MKLCVKAVVVGGGPAGSIAAKTLAQHGIPVVLLERNLSLVKPCGGGLALNAFTEMNIPKHTMKREVNKIRLISPAGNIIDIDLTEGNLAIVERGEFDKALRQQAEELGAKIIEAEVTGIKQSSRYIIEAVSGEKKYEITSEYVIAADGINSKMRRSLGIKTSRAFFTMSEHIKGIDAACCEFWFGAAHAPRAYSWVFPSGDGISIGTGSFEQGRISDLYASFKEKRGITTNGSKHVYRIPVWAGDLYNRDKIIFAGDAAGQVLPLTYEGIYYAMKAGEFAARAIIDNKVDNYRKLWKSRFQKRFVLMGKLQNYFLKDDAAAERLVAIHRRPEIQEASLRLWLMKDSSTSGLVSYIKLFGKILR
jgi:geranylgeranyl diphosphate/geranylgeranyl-bacteriochlorophyllide a reductase